MHIEKLNWRFTKLAYLTLKVRIASGVLFRDCKKFFCESVERLHWWTDTDRCLMHWTRSHRVGTTERLWNSNAGLSEVLIYYMNFV